MIHFETQDCQDLQAARSREWLVTNGIGGYASSTMAGMNTRRYHGLLVAATLPPLGRIVMLSQLEDVLIVDGTRFELSTNLYQGDVLHPSGYRFMVRFTNGPIPAFTYAHDNWEIEKTIFMVQDENTTVIEYRLTRSAPGSAVSLAVRPLIAFRDYHATTHENDAINRTVEQTPGCVELFPYPDRPRLYLAHDAAEVEADGFWYRGFEYEQERARGMDHVEDLFSPLVLRTPLAAGSSFTLIASTEKRAVSTVAESRAAALGDFGATACGLVPALQRAADQFIATRFPHKTVLAGYHWLATGTRHHDRPARTPALDRSPRDRLADPHPVRPLRRRRHVAEPVSRCRRCAGIQHRGRHTLVL